MNNSITYQDFRILKSERLRIDYITIHLTNPSSNQELANYLKDLGFHSYQQKSGTNQSQQRIQIQTQTYSETYYEANFITNIPYWDGIQIHFSGLNANHFYNCIKKSRIPILKDIGGILSRIDIFFDRIPNFNDSVTNQEFINSLFLEFQSLHPNKKFMVEKNRKGFIVKIGHRKSPKDYRIYLKDQFLRFEFEIKDNFTQNLQMLLLENRFEEFEQHLAYQFFKYSFNLFQDSIHTSHLDWLMARIRPYQSHNFDKSNNSILCSHYINQFTLTEFQDKSDLITFLQFIIYARSLNYTIDSLGSTHYRLVHFRVQDFLNYSNRSKNHYQLNKLITFFDQLQKNSLIRFFDDNYYRGLITVPQVNLRKDTQKSWVAQVWLAEELFNYLHPFLFKDFFRGKLTKDQFEVLFYILQIFSFRTSRKEIDYTNFITNYSSVLNNSRKQQIKKYFIQSLQILANQKQIKEKVLLLPSNRISQIHQLNSSHLQQNERIIIVEFIPIIFQEINPF